MSLWVQTHPGRTVIRTPEAGSSGPGPKKGHDRAARIGGSDPETGRSSDPRTPEKEVIRTMFQRGQNRGYPFSAVCDAPIIPDYRGEIALAKVLVNTL